MARHMEIGLVTLLGCALAGVPASVRAADQASHAGARIAAISGVHEPHQGFALSDTVLSDRLCLELAQNLASELGIAVHVVCTDTKTGESTIVAECGYAADPNAKEVGGYSKPWWGGASYLICIPGPRDRFRAHRIAPDLSALRP